MGGGNSALHGSALCHFRVLSSTFPDLLVCFSEIFPDTWAVLLSLEWQNLYHGNLSYLLGCRVFSRGGRMTRNFSFKYPFIKLYVIYLLALPNAASRPSFPFRVSIHSMCPKDTPKVLQVLLRATILELHSIHKVVP